MHAKEFGGSGVIVLRLLKRLADRLAHGVVDGVLQARSPDQAGGPGDLAASRNANR